MDIGARVVSNPTENNIQAKIMFKARKDRQLQFRFYYAVQKKKTMLWEDGMSLSVVQKRPPNEIALTKRLTSIFITSSWFKSLDIKIKYVQFVVNRLNDIA